MRVHAFFIRNRFIRNSYYDRQNVKKLLVLPQIPRIELRNRAKDIPIEKRRIHFEKKRKNLGWRESGIKSGKRLRLY